MSQTVSVGGVDFQVAAVPGRTVDAILADPTLLQGIWRDVYRWDARAQAGKVLVAATKDKAVPLPNAITFFIPRVTSAGIVTKNLPASDRMGTRFLNLVDAASVAELAKAIAGLMQQPQRILPLAVFAPLNGCLSYTLRMHVSFAMVQLRHPAEDLSVFIGLPSRVTFHHEIAAIIDPVAYADLTAADFGVKHLRVSFVVSARSKANAELRKLALRKRIKEFRAEIAASVGIADAGAGRAFDTMRDRLAEAEAEYEALA